MFVPRCAAGARLEKLRSEDEWIVIVETCHQCESHASWHRHDPQEYRHGMCHRCIA